MDQDIHISRQGVLGLIFLYAFWGIISANILPVLSGFIGGAIFATLIIYTLMSYSFDIGTKVFGDKWLQVLGTCQSLIPKMLHLYGMSSKDNRDIKETKPDMKLYAEMRKIIAMNNLDSTMITKIFGIHPEKAIRIKLVALDGKISDEDFIKLLMNN